MRNVRLIAGPILAVAVILAASPMKAGADDSCVRCHLELGGELGLPAEQLPKSAHGEAQLSCADCHGGDPQASDMEDAMSAAKGYVGAPSRIEIPGFCGKCHSDERYMRKYRPRIAVDQELAYWTSVHGTRLRAGDKQVADCTSCHGSHLILPVNDVKSDVYPTNVPSTCGRCHGDAAYMAGYDLPVDQLEKYKQSVHGVALLEKGDIGAPACNDCHGNHGAAPPGVTSVANVCGYCHSSARDLFVTSPHKEAYDAAGFSECVVCHGNHLVSVPTDSLIGVEKGSICLECHDEGDAGFEAAAEMSKAISSLNGRLQDVSGVIERAARAGVEMSDEELKLRTAKSRLVITRNLIHSFDPDTVKAAADEGDTLLAEINKAGLAAFKEISIRRWGFALSSLVIVLLIAGLYLTLKNVQRGSKKS